MDGIQTPRYPHLDRGRNGSTGHPGGEDGVVGVLRGWGGGEGDDGGLGLGIIQGLQGLGRDGDGDGHADGGHEAEEVHAVGMTNGGRERDPRDRLSGSTIVNDDSAYEGPGKAGYTNGAAARDGAPEDVEESDSRADESMRDSPDGDEVRSDEEEEDVVEARINRKVSILWCLHVDHFTRLNRSQGKPDLITYARAWAAADCQVADLEISNASLMAINRSLESKSTCLLSKTRACSVRGMFSMKLCADPGQVPKPSSAPRSSVCADNYASPYTSLLASLGVHSSPPLCLSVPVLVQGTKTKTSSTWKPKTTPMQAISSWKSSPAGRQWKSSSGV